MGLSQKLIFGGVLTSSLLITNCGTSDKEWARYLEEQVPCEFTIQKNESTYWKIADRLKANTKFEDWYTGFIAQKLENYQNNPQFNHLRPGLVIVIPCGLSEQ